ncbi:hypothetical protein D3C87_1970810 [compost metagenome]
MAERFHRERVEVRADPAELEHRQCKHHDEQGKRHGLRAVDLNEQPHEGDDDKADQRAM